MAKASVIQRNLRRIIKVKLFLKKRTAIKEIICNKSISLEERFNAQLQLSSLPKDSARVRVKNRCELTGRSKGYYRKFKLSRICLRSLASEGKLPGVIKSSW